MTALIITYYWPPSSGSGVQRWMYFAKYLGEFGIKPVVLTVKPDKASYRYLDESLNEHVSHISTHRTNTREPLKLYSLLKSGSSRKAIPHGHVGEKKSLVGRFGNFIRSNFYVPDARKGWNKFAMREARKIISEHDPDLIITTGTPHSTHLIGLRLKAEFGAKWLADFRDPWTELYYNKELKRLPFAWRKDKALELNVLRNADAVVSVGPSLSRLLADKLQPDEHSKFHHILNGYDANKMQLLTSQPQKKFTMTFIGLLTVHQPFHGIVNAIKEVALNQPEFVSNAQLAFAGTIEDEITDMCKQVQGLEVVNHGRLSHEASLQLMLNSNLLLNCLPETEDAKFFITGKMMEYLATGHPVLTVGPLDGDAAALLDETTNSKTFLKDDQEEMAGFIGRVFTKWDAGETSANKNMERISKYSRYETTRQLAELIKSM